MLKIFNEAAISGFLTFALSGIWYHDISTIITGILTASLLIINMIEKGTWRG
ncbi:hypothetical protein LABALGNA3A7_05360 [Dellaglioa algida]|nr:hypothetical protein LABALGNA3A7_05360 [Dellaglioa algida]